MPRKPLDLTTLLSTYLRFAQHMNKWALIAKGHMDAGRRKEAKEAFAKAEYWERRLQKLTRR